MIRSRHISRFAPVLLAIAACHLPVAAQTQAGYDRQLAREQAELTTTAGRTVRGLLDGFRDGRLHVRLATDGGEVGYLFAPGEIARLVLPGADLEAEALERIDRGEIAQAMPLLEALGRQRIRYLPVLDAPRQRALWELSAHARAATDPHTVRAVVRAMAPLADTPDKRLALLEAELDLAMLAGAGDDVRALAARWCAAADPAGRSALGWRVLAQLAYESGDDDRALWLALQPVTFAAQPGMRDLDRCFAIAIGAAERNGDREHAEFLRRDMQARQLPWPADVTLAKATPRAPGRPATARVAPPGPIDHVRKIPIPHAPLPSH